MDIEYFNNKIISIWKDQNVTELVPMLYNEPNKNTILFIGINPSFSEKGFKSILKETEYDNVLKDPFGFYSKVENINIEKIAVLKKIEQIARDKYNYFAKFREIAEQIKEFENKWDHIDLLQIRSTNQKKIEKLIREDSKFIKKQIMLSLELIDYIHPKVIVVENAFVRRILTKEFDNGIVSEEIDDKIGTYFYFSDKKLPIFFTSMLSGGRALDTGSYERLKWHIKFVLSKVEEK
jgi:hypothetical protein